MVYRITNIYATIRINTNAMRTIKLCFYRRATITAAAFEVRTLTCHRTNHIRCQINFSNHLIFSVHDKDISLGANCYALRAIKGRF